MRTRYLSTHEIARAGLAVALLAVSSWVTIPVGPVPFTLQTMALVLVVLTLPARSAMISVACYVLLGACGLPVFSGMRGGIGVLAGPTGGFIIGFVLGTIVAETILARGRTPLWERIAAFALIAVSYAFGWAQLMVVTGMGPVPAFLAACAPFIIPDVVKAFVGIRMARSVRKAFPSMAEANADYQS